MHARIAIAMVVFCACTTFAADSAPKEDVIGSGNGSIHIIPSLSRPSVKNGEKITVSAVVKATHGVHSVTADMGGVDTIELKPASAKLGGVNADGILGLWTAEWTGHDLQEKYYTVALRVMDRIGQEFEDRSLEFSDPIAGLQTVGTQLSEQGIRRASVLTLDSAEKPLSCAVIDLANGYAYCGTNTTPSLIIKIALGGGAALPEKVGFLTLDPGENNVTCGVLDAANGFAYFGTSTVPGKVVQVALGVGAALPFRVSALTLNPLEDNLSCAVINTATSHAYFATRTSPAQVVKIKLGAGSPIRLGAASTTVSSITCGVIDASANYAYFGNTPSSGAAAVVKLNLGAADSLPSQVGSVSMIAGDSSRLTSAVIDPVNSCAFFAASRDNNEGAFCRVIKVSLGAGDDAPTRSSFVELSTGEFTANAAAIDSVGGFAYFAAGAGGNTRVVKIQIGPGVPIRIDTLDTGVPDIFNASIIDLISGNLYFTSSTRFARFIKTTFRGGAANNQLQNLGLLELSNGQNFINGAAINPAAGRIYFSGGDFNNRPGFVTKLDIGAGKEISKLGSVYASDIVLTDIFYHNVAIDLHTNANPSLNREHIYATSFSFSNEGIAKFSPGTTNGPPLLQSRASIGSTPSYVLVDSSNGFAYVGTSSTQFITQGIRKVALQPGATSPTLLGSFPLSGSEQNVACAVIDPVRGFGYLGIDSVPARIVRFSLGVGVSPPTRVDHLDLQTGENSVRSAIIDVAEGYACFGTGTTPGKVVKIALGTDSVAPMRLGALTLNAGENNLFSATLDPTNKIALFGTDTAPGRIIQVDVNSNTPARMDAITLQSGENNLRSAAIDDSGYAYFATYSAPSKVIRVALKPGVAQIKASRIAFPESAVVNEMRFYSHAAGGTFRFSIYDNASPKNLIWQSNEVPNPTANTEIKVPISSGTPAELPLNGGTYWLAWQYAGTASAPSITTSDIGNGFTLNYLYKQFPSTLSGETLTNERYTQYLQYYAKPKFVITGTSSQGAGSTQTITITARDSANNVSTDYTGARNLVFTGAGSTTTPVNNPTANGVSLGQSTPVTFVNGVATVSLILYKMETAQIAASDAGLTITTPVPFNVNVSVGALHHYSITGTSTQSAGSTQNVTIVAQDAVGNTLVGISGNANLRFSGASASPGLNAPLGNGIAFGTSVGVTFAAGIANSVPIQLFNAESAAIAVTNVATPAINTPAPLIVQVSPLGLNKFGISGSTTQSSGSTQTLSVSALDLYSNLVTTLSSTQNVLFSGANPAPNGAQPKANGFTFGGSVPLSFAAGIASVGLELNKVEGALVLVTAGSILTPTPLNVNVTPGAAASLELSSASAFVQGLSQSLLLTARDAFGNTAKGYLGTIRVTTTDTLATLPADFTFVAGDQGVKNFSITLRLLGVQVVTTTDTVTSALTKSQNVTVTSNGIVSPQGVADVYQVNEDGTLVVNAANGLLANDSDPLSLPLGAAKFSDPSNGTVLVNSDGSFTYSPTANFNGVDTFTYKANNGTLPSGETTVTITVNSINDAPLFTKGLDQTVRADSGEQSIVGWANGIATGPGNESAQTMAFTVTNNNATIFKDAPTVDSNGILKFTPLLEATGSATVSVTLKDNGGVTAGGIDTSTAQTFVITINPAPAVLASQSASGMVGAPLSLTLSAGGKQPVTFSLGSALPGGLTLSGNRISGIPTVSGTFDVTIRASNGIAPDDEKFVRIVVMPALLITTYAGSGTGPFAGDDGPADQAKLNAPFGLTVDATGNLYIADTLNHRIRRVDVLTGKISTFAGTGTAGSSGDGSTASAAQLNSPGGLAVDATGNLYIADTNNHKIRRITPAGTISTFAGTGTAGATGDGGAATSAQLNSPSGVAIDSAGNLYIADRTNHRIRKISGGQISTVAGTGTAGFNGDNAGTSSQLSSPFGIALDAAGNLYIADQGNHRIRMLSSGGALNTFAGTGATGFGGDGGAATSAIVQGPLGVTADTSGNVYASDSTNRVRRIDSAGTIITLAGTGTANFAGDNGPSVLGALNSPSGLAVDGLGRINVADRLNQRVRRIGVARPPQVASALVATPALAKTGDTIQFSVSIAADLALTYAWNFGDGSSENSSTSTISHTYAAPQSYSITLTATDVQGNSVSATTMVVITVNGNPPDDINNNGIPNDLDEDSDGDGVPNKMELALSTNPLDPTDLPIGPTPSTPISAAKSSLTLAFTKPNSDVISLSGLISFPPGKDLNAKKIALSFGGVIAAFDVTQSGTKLKVTSSPVNKNNTIKLATKNGSTAFQIKLNKGSFQTNLSDEGFTQTSASGVLKTVRVLLIVDDLMFNADPSLLFIVKSGKGSAK